MSSLSKPPLSVEESITILQAKIKELPSGDDLVIKVYRKRGGGAFGGVGIPDILATLSGARLKDVASPEMWLPRLAGAGAFLLSAYAPENAGVPLVANIPFIVEGTPREVDLDAVADPAWRGPTKLEWPERRTNQPQTGYSVNLVPPGPPLVTAPQTQSSGTGTPGAHSVPQQAPGIDLAAWMAQKERELAEVRAAAERDRERLIAEAQREKDRVTFEARLAALDARLAQTQAAPPAVPAAPKESLADIVKAVIPFAQQLLAGQQEMRLEMVRSQQANAGEMRELMKTLMTRPAVDPTFLALMERRDANEQPASVILAQTTTAMSTMMENTMLMARQVAESSGAPPESPMLAAFREVAGAAQKLIDASIQASKPRPRPRPRPAGQPPAPHAAATAGPASPGHAPALSSNVVPFQRPSGIESDDSASRIHGFAGVESDGSENQVDILERMIRMREDPAKVAAFLIQVFYSEDFQEALAQANGSIPSLFQARLGDWSLDPVNLPYAQALLEQVSTQGATAGIFQEEPSADEQDEEQGVEG